LKVETVDDLLVKLFDIKIKAPSFVTLTVEIKGDRVVHIAKKQGFKEKSEVRR
jgi:hypothetical protein